MIVDDELNRLIVNPLLPGVRLHVVLGKAKTAEHLQLPGLHLAIKLHCGIQAMLHFCCQVTKMMPPLKNAVKRNSHNQGSLLPQHAVWIEQEIAMLRRSSFTICASSNTPGAKQSPFPYRCLPFWLSHGLGIPSQIQAQSRSLLEAGVCLATFCIQGKLLLAGALFTAHHHVLMTSFSALGVTFPQCNFLQDRGS